MSLITINDVLCVFSVRIRTKKNSQLNITTYRVFDIRQNPWACWENVSQDSHQIRCWRI